MILPAISIKRTIATSMVYIIIIGFGIFSLLRLKLDLFPDLSFPAIVVLTNYKGAAPKDVENLVTKPIEGAVSSVEGIREIYSTSEQGNSIVLAKFAWGTDMDEAERQVQKYIDMYAKPILPDDATDPIAFAFDPSLQPILFFIVKGNGKSLSEVRKISVDRLESLINRVPGVAQAFTMGGPKRQINIKLYPERLRALDVSILTVLRSLRASNILVPGGTLDSGLTEYNITTIGDFSSIDEIKNVPIGVRNNNIIKLSDISEIEDGESEEKQITRHNGENNVMLLVRRQPDANTLETVDNVLNYIEELKKKDLFPKGIKLDLFFSQSEIVKLALGNLNSNAIQALVITIIILFLFTGSIRSSFAVAVSIPVSVIATFSVMDQMNISLNVISMAGLALAIGMLVDNSIVVSENIFRLLKEGKSPFDAALRGSSEVSGAIVSSTLTTIAVFAPVLFVPGIAGELFKDMSLTICFSLSVSLFVALTLAPMLNYQLFRLRGGIREKKGFTGFFPRFIEKIINKYGTTLAYCLNHKKKTIFLSFVFFILSLLFGSQFLEIDFLQQSDEGFFMVYVDAKPGITLSEFDKSIRMVEETIKERAPEAEQVTANFGVSEGFETLIGQSANKGFLRVKLPPLSARKRNQREIQRDLSLALKEIPGIECRIGHPNITGGEGDMEIKIFNDDLKRLKSFGNDLARKIREVEGISSAKFSLDAGQPELAVRLKRKKLKELGIMPEEVTQTISTYFQGTRAGIYREGGSEYDILVRADKDFRNDEKYLGNLPIKLPISGTLPLYAVADIVDEDAPAKVEHFNQKRVATISINKDEKFSMGKMLKNVKKMLNGYEVPPDFQITIMGAAEDMQTSFKWLAIAFFVAIFLVYMVMASQFESLFEPFIILFSIPLSIIGVVIMLAITKTTLQITAMIGVIMLVGIVVNNAIVLVTYIKQQRDQGMELREAAIHSGKTRIRPVLMTTLTTVLAMVPLAMEIGEGSESWSPMARSIIGGLSVSTLLTLYVIPVLYVLFVTRVNAFKKRLGIV